MTAVVAAQRGQPEPLERMPHRMADDDDDRASTSGPTSSRAKNSPASATTAAASPRRTRSVGGQHRARPAERGGSRCLMRSRPIQHRGAALARSRTGRLRSAATRSLACAVRRSGRACRLGWPARRRHDRATRARRPMTRWWRPRDRPRRRRPAMRNTAATRPGTVTGT